MKTLWSKMTSQRTKSATTSRCNTIKAIEGFVVGLEIVVRPRSNQKLLGFFGGGAGSDRALSEIARDRLLTSPWDLSD